MSRSTTCGYRWAARALPTDMYLPLKGIQWVPGRESDRQLPGGEIRTADVGSGSKAGPGSFDRAALNRSATPVRREISGRRHGVAAENSRWRRDAPWWPCVHSGRVPGTPPATLPEHAAREGRRRFASRQEIVRGPARRVGLLSPRFEGMVRDRLMSQFAVGGVELLMSGHSVVLGVSSLRGAGLLRCASSRGVPASRP